MNRFWGKVIKPIFLKEQPKVIVEIGAFRGENTVKILRYCRRNHAKLHVIDPLPQFNVRQMKRCGKQHFTLIRALSLKALPRIPNPDVLLIDGDHNWYTVYHELKCVERSAKKTGKFPIVMLHDTEWPYGRRDSYYLPETIPPPYRKPYAKKGIVLGKSRLVNTGGLNYQFNNALYENGEKNGVLTAIEDFLKETSFPITFHRVASHNGLGILVHKDELKDRWIQEVLKKSRL
ncbi:class I SAM-dependent methyltransferase [Salinithrix halophila]|uniref:Class I SAM-dependent methyltransferase n=1 Tax=Salinithrix halophila TaxID=1485204 RepID=A0ABV8JI09_9BACL